MPVLNQNGETVEVTAPTGAGENAQEVAAPAEDSTHDKEHSSVAEKSPDEDTTADDTSAGENTQEVAACRRGRCQKWAGAGHSGAEPRGEGQAGCRPART